MNSQTEKLIAEEQTAVSFVLHLTDIFLDWNGPYALVCDCKDDTSKGISGDCPFFKKSIDPYAFMTKQNNQLL